MPADAHAIALAMRLATDAGQVARAAFGSHIMVEAKSSPLDGVTEIDRSAERLIIAGIKAAYPGDSVVSEEAGATIGHSDSSWLIDPLDGTNNFAIGLPLYGLSITHVRGTQPDLAIVQNSHLAYQLVASAGAPVRAIGGLTIRDASAAALDTIALQQGYAVDRADRKLARTRNCLETRFRRVLYTWSPSVDVTLLASGAIGGIVGYRCLGSEHVAARFVSTELGCEVRLVEPIDPLTGLCTYVIGWTSTIDRLTEIVDTSLNTDR